MNFALFFKDSFIAFGFSCHKIAMLALFLDETLPALRIVCVPSFTVDFLLCPIKYAAC